MKGRIRLVRLWWLIVALALVSTGCGGSDGDDYIQPDYSRAIAATRSFVKAGMAEQNVAGLAVGLVDGDRIVWLEGFGMADRAAGRAVGADTVFEIGSISKTMTAAVIMRLVEAGRLDLDRPLTDYLPDFSMRPRYPDDAPITIRMTLTHHSGIPGDMLTNAATVESDPDYEQRLLAYLADYYPTYPTDTFLAYSNMALTVAGRAAAAAAGRPFVRLGDDFLADLELNDTAFSRPARLEPRTAKPYYYDRELPLFHMNFKAAGGAVSTIRDLAGYARAMMLSPQGRNPALSAASAAEMFRPQNAEAPLDLNRKIGLTWFLSDHRLNYAGRVVGHGGATLGYNADLVILLDQSLAAVALCNSAQAAPLVHETTRRLLIGAIKAKSGLTPPEPVPGDAAPQPLPPDRLAELAGVYVYDSRGYDRVRVAGQHLEIRPVGGDRWLPLIHRDNGYFTHGDDQSAYYEFTDIDGRFLLVVHIHGESFIRSQKYEPPAVPAAWDQRIGVWRLVDLPAIDASNYLPDELRLVGPTVELYRDGDLLMFNAGVNGVHVIDPAGPDLGFFHGLGRSGQSALIARNHGGTERLTFLSYYYEKAPGAAPPDQTLRRTPPPGPVETLVRPTL